MKSLKLKLIISNILLCLAVLLLIGTTIAYFSETKQITNTLTAGNVKIRLSEAAVKSAPNGDLIEDPDASRIWGTEENTTHDYGTIFPGQSIFKDPTIENYGTENAWIAAKVVINDGSGDIHRLLGYPSNPGLDIRLMLSGGLLDEAGNVGSWNGLDDVFYNDNFALVQVPNPTEDEYTFYFFLNNKFEKYDSTVLFNNMYVDEFWGNDLLQELRELTITIQGYGVQAAGIESCFEAMTSAFPSHFNF